MSVLARQHGYNVVRSLEKDNQALDQIEAAFAELFSSGVLSGGVVTQSGAFGVSVASGTKFFSRGVTLTLTEAATLSGLTPGAPSTTNYVWGLIKRTGGGSGVTDLDTYALELSANETGTAPSADHIPLATIPTGASGITSIDDAPAGKFIRAWPNAGYTVITTTGGGTITATATQARNGVLYCSGTPSGTVTLVLPTVAGEVHRVCNDSDQSLIVKTAAGSGVTMDADSSVTLFCDGTDIKQVGAGSGSSHSHTNIELLASYDQTNADLTDAVTKKHAHGDLALLESYTNANADISSAISLAHARNGDEGTSNTDFTIRRGYTGSPEELTLTFERGSGANTRFLIDTSGVLKYGEIGSEVALALSSYAYAYPLEESAGTVSLLYDNTQLKIDGSNQLAPIQNIHTGATPTFAGLSLTAPLPVLSGGTGASTATAARTNLGLGSIAVKNTLAPADTLLAATARILGRVTAGAGAAEELTAAQVKTLLGYTKSDIDLGNVENTALSPHTGDHVIHLYGLTNPGAQKMPRMRTDGAWEWIDTPAGTGHNPVSIGGGSTAFLGIGESSQVLNFDASTLATASALATHAGLTAAAHGGVLGLFGLADPGAVAKMIRRKVDGSYEWIDTPSGTGSPPQGLDVTDSPQFQGVLLQKAVTSCGTVKVKREVAALTTTDTSAHVAWSYGVSGTKGIHLRVLLTGYAVEGPTANDARSAQVASFVGAYRLDGEGGIVQETATKTDGYGTLETDSLAAINSSGTTVQLVVGYSNSGWTIRWHAEITYMEVDTA